jgi:(1->4)-alpha-D-glucan 1-alpha-D-glucosylmutase
VDFDARIECLRRQGAAATLDGWRGGAVKQQIIHAALTLRRRDPLLFAAGAYVPLAVHGALADHVIAFARVHEESCAVVIVSRLAAGLLGDDDRPLVPPAAWRDTRIALPEGCAAAAWRDALSGSSIAAREGGIVLSEALVALPVALLCPAREPA